MVTDKRGASALWLQLQLGLRRYETAWLLLHKLRRAMVNAAREPQLLVRFTDVGRKTLPAKYARLEPA